MAIAYLSKSVRTFVLMSVVVVVLAFDASAARIGTNSTVVLVDKKTNKLVVSEYVDGAYRALHTFHATLGKVQGDKENEGDLKTPEGIYIFNVLRKPPNLQPKFGVMGFYMNFPNPFDLLAGRNGSDIMLHATDEPKRLEKNYDSEGCVVVKNEQILEIQPYIRLGLTPILIFDELTDEYTRPGRDAGLVTFFEGWIHAWENKDVERYISHYHSDFSAQGKNRNAWRSYKAGLNERYAMIRVVPENVHYYRHPKYSMITFTQNYQSQLRGGRLGHRSRGTKILYVAEEAGKPRIISEAYTTLMW
jgi:murein L,D-transpeptidase YafK